MANKIATRQAYGEALVELGKKYDNLIVLDADLSKSTMTAGFSKEYPDRFFNMGIAEQNLYGTAAGLAVSGKIVCASTFAMFAAGRAFEIIRNSIGYTKANVKICATHAGITVGEDGASHQVIEDLALMRSIPGMVVLNPADGNSAKRLVEAAIEYNGPVYVRLGRLATPIFYEENADVEIGKGNVLRDGSDYTIIATGFMVNEAIQAAELLKSEGISIRVIDMHTIKPIDKDIIIKAAKETKGIVTAEEHNIIGGLGGAVAEVVTENCPIKMKIVGIKDKFGQSGKPLELVEEYGLTAKDLVLAVKSLV
ncbi:transketolase family protein [Anaerovorax odorimutans]|uniref:transketolase family protein n=1 Tax=Anaerovorax odorimutans TaxID=109327 RepID=UPI00041B35AD|nr:transketolase family protein [Anaerovorax odorimutans]